MKMFAKTIRSASAFLLVAALFLGFCSSPIALAAGDLSSKTEINYVSFGASNVNGYGLEGYLPEGINLTNKDQMNIYGYQKMPEGSYPFLLAQAFNAALGGEENLSDYKGATEEKPFSKVNVDQLAMSSMRAEELRFLLDETYTGDGYTAWRFYDHSNPNAQKWFYGAGKMAAGNPNATNVEAIAALRNEYAMAITNADVITFDLGVNNFGVFLSLSHRWENDINNVNPAMAAYYAEAKAYITEYIVGNYGEAALLLEEMDSLIDAIAYTLVGFCTSFDIVMEKIYTLNPDATVVVVSIQNLMAGLNIELGGSVIPLGDILGAAIDGANAYTAFFSPYSDKYYYADVSENGRVEFFLEQLQAYDGNPATLDKNMTDCFDLYDNNLYITNRLQFILAQATVPNFVDLVKDAYNIPASVKDEVVIFGTFLADAPAFSNAKQEYRTSFAGLYAALNDPATMRPLQLKAYDVLAECFKAAVEENTVNSSGLINTPSGVENAILEEVMMLALLTTVEAYQTGTLGEDFTLPEGFFQSIANKCGVSLDDVMSVACFGVRTGIGNSFYGHPNLEGHKQIASTVLAAIENETKGEDLRGTIFGRIVKGLRSLLISMYGEDYVSATNADYYLYEDSYYVALGDKSAAANSYVDLLASEIGVEHTNLSYEGLLITDTPAFIAENAEVISKADLISIGYSANVFTNEMVSQINNVMMNKPVTVYDWAALVGEENVPSVEQAIDEVHSYLVSAGMDVVYMGRNLADLLTYAVEAYAYAFAEYSLTYPEVVASIREVNPDALVVIVGLYNTLDGITLKMNDTELAIGSYVKYIIDVANLQSVITAMAGDNILFVATPDVETIKESTSASADYDMLAFMMEIIRNKSAAFYPSENGYVYIKDCILSALTVKDPSELPEPDPDPDPDPEPEPEPEPDPVIYGDADNDGDIDSTDAMLILQYDALLVEEGEIVLDACDVDGDGDVDSTDAMLILQYDALLIESFPAQK